VGVLKFIFSKTFLINLLIAIGVVVALCFGYLFWLDYHTNHNDTVEVPDLKRLTLAEANIMLADHDLLSEIQDSVAYNPEFPPRSVIEQNPPAGAQVKENRKIYLKLNQSDYSKVVVPNLVERTKRQAIPTLQSLGFRIGDITYKYSIAKDMVLEMRHNGNNIKPGERLPRTSKIDLVLGDDEMDKQ